MTRTVRLVLSPTAEQVPLLTETSRQFTEAFNAVCAYGWDNEEKNGVRLHHATYHPLKERLPDLVSDLHCQARVKATEALRSAFALKAKDRQVSQPRSVSCPPRLNVHTFTLRWAGGEVRLSTTSGRTTIPFTVPAFSAKWAGGKALTADLIERDGKWWLHVSVEVDAPKVAPSPDIVGVDLGLAHPAVTSNNRFLGRRGWRRVEERNFRLRRALQRTRTKSAKRHLKMMCRRQARFRRDCDHVLSKQIVASVEPGGTVVLEDLKHIRSRVKTRRKAQARRLHGWSFAQLLSFVRYKAEGRGCMVELVDAAYTSQACSRCGHTARNNRRSQSAFQCRQCGYRTNADRNAARNIAVKYRSAAGMSCAGWPTVNWPNVGDHALHGSLTSCRL